MTLLDKNHPFGGISQENIFREKEKIIGEFVLHLNII